MFFQLLSVLEQFRIIPIVPVVFGPVDLSLTNEVVIIILFFFFFVTFVMSLLIKDNTLYMIPNRYQMIIEQIYKAILSLVVDNIRHKEAQAYFPLVLTIFLGILGLNLIGLVPYSFTATSHLIVTFSIALSLFIGINIICVREHGIHFF